ncbi:MAG: hypothetical protein HKN18_16160 [Silicimonas sp.]|nr:hypothetical protein [Silicimonas sp.]
MVPLLILLALGVFGYLFWKHRFTTLTPMCRWREDRAAGDWHCAACGARMVPKDGKAPRHCLRKP